MGYAVDYGQYTANVYKKEAEKLITNQEKKIIKAEKTTPRKN